MERKKRGAEGSGRDGLGVGGVGKRWDHVEEKEWEEDGEVGGREVEEERNLACVWRCGVPFYSIFFLALLLFWGIFFSPVHTRISTRFQFHTCQSRFERGGLNPDSFKSYVTGSELKSSCERGF